MFDGVAKATTFPSKVRLVGSDDRARLIQFYVETLGAYTSQFGSFDLDAIELMVDKAISRDLALIAIIDGPDRIEAGIGFMPAKPWWGGDDSWYWTEVGIAVHPQHRKSGHFRELMRFAKWFAANAGAPVVMNVQPEQDLSRKLTAFSRTARMVGGIFLIGGR
jgi:GNAT superfamily N-acetyltransferase